MTTYTVDQIAKNLNVTGQTVRRWIHEGKLDANQDKCLKNGRIGKFLVPADSPKNYKFLKSMEKLSPAKKSTPKKKMDPEEKQYRLDLSIRLLQGDDLESIINDMMNHL